VAGETGCSPAEPCVLMRDRMMIEPLDFPGARRSPAPCDVECRSGPETGRLAIPQSAPLLCWNRRIAARVCRLGSIPWQPCGRFPHPSRQWRPGFAIRRSCLACPGEHVQRPCLLRSIGWACHLRRPVTLPRKVGFSTLNRGPGFQQRISVG
jgi:hypothetical protein